MKKQEKVIILTTLVVIFVMGVVALNLWDKQKEQNPVENDGIDYLKYESYGYTREKIDQIFGRIELLEEAIKSEPDAFDYYLQIGSLYKMIREYELAEQAYLKSIEINPDFAAGYAELANIYIYPMGRLEEAEENYLIAIEKTPFRSDYYRWLADLWVSKFPEKKPEIEGLMLKGVAEGPANSTAFYGYLVNYFEREGNYNKAIYYAQKAIANDPENEILKQDLERIKTLQ